MTGKESDEEIDIRRSRARVSFCHHNNEAQPYGYGMMGGHGYGMMGGYGAGMMYGNGLHSSGSSYRPGMMYGYRYNYRTCRTTMFATTSIMARE